MTKSERLYQVIATCCYLGYSPIMPGTVASMMTSVWVWFFPWSSLVWSMLAVGLFFIGWHAADRYALYCADDDPSCIVIDEVVGMIIALLWVPRVIEMYIIAFLLFRLYDITKLFPINYVERRVQGGLGIMLDDVAAGIIARGVIILACWL